MPLHLPQPDIYFPPQESFIPDENIDCKTFAQNEDQEEDIKMDSQDKEEPRGKDDMEIEKAIVNNMSTQENEFTADKPQEVVVASVCQLSSASATSWLMVKRGKRMKSTIFHELLDEDEDEDDQSDSTQL